MKNLRKFRFCSHHISVSECRYSVGTQVHLKCRPTSYNGSDVGDEYNYYFVQVCSYFYAECNTF